MQDSKNRLLAKSILDSIPENLLEDAIRFLENLKKSSENKKKIEADGDSEKIVIYTDGGCHGNPGAGGWGAVIIANGEEKRLSGGEKMTTNNRMELSAAISALSAVFSTPNFCGQKVSIFTDSQYVKNGISNWISGWKKNGWLTKAKKSVLNRDLWEKLDELNQKIKPEWNWVKGHAGIEYNEICDSLCQTEIAKFE